MQIDHINDSICQAHVVLRRDSLHQTKQTIVQIQAFSNE